MSLNDHPPTTVNVKEQIRLRNEEVKRKEEAQYRLVAKTIQKNENSSISNIYNKMNSSYSIGGHYSSLKTKKENEGSHYIPSLNGQKKHSSLYSLSSDNISGNFNTNPNVLVLNIRDVNSKANLSEGNEFSLTLNEPITDCEADRTRMTHLAEYFKMEYNDALKDALRTINMERKFEQRRRKNQDERWESLIKEGRGPSPTELELQRKDREKIDELSRNRETEVTNGVNKNFENKLNFEAEVRDNMDNLIKHWSGKLWSEIIEFLEKGPKSEDSEEEESSEEEEESSTNEESETASDRDGSDEKLNEQEGSKEDKLNEAISGNQTPQTSSLEIGEEGKKSELKIEQKLKKSVQSLKPGIEEDSNNQNQCSVTSLSNEKQENPENQERNANLNELELVNELEETMKSIQNLETLNVIENPKNETDKNVEKVEVIDISAENKEESDIDQYIEQDVEQVEVEEINNVNHLTDELRMENNSKSSLSQIITQNLEKPPQHFSSIEGDSKSYIEILDENGNKRETVNDDMIDDKLKSAPAVLEDDKNEKLISPESAMNIKSINPVYRSQKTEIPYILKHQDKKSLTYDYIKCKPRLSSECRSQVASEVIQMLDDNKLMRASESTPLVAEPGVSILKRIMKKLKKNKPSDNKYDNNEVDYQTISLFGSHLDLLYDNYKDIPPFIKECKKYIKAKGIQKQGIFRISGRSGDIKDLKNKFQVELEFYDIRRQVQLASKIKDDKQRKDRINFIKSEKKRLQQENPNLNVSLFDLSPTESSVASVFKLFFRELVEPLFTFRMYKLWILLDDITDKGFKIKLASHLILLLPFTHRLMLHYLLHFLTIVASHADVNEMNSSNLAKVFAPNILRYDDKKKENKPSVELHEKANNVIEFLIDNNVEIFEAGSELIVSIENMIKEFYDEEEQNSLRNGSGKSKSHFSIAKAGKSQSKANRNSGIEDKENRKSPLTLDEK